MILPPLSGPIYMDPDALPFHFIHNWLPVIWPWGRCIALTGSLWALTDLTEQLNHFHRVCCIHARELRLSFEHLAKGECVFCAERREEGRGGEGERRHGCFLLSRVQAASGWKQWIKGRVMALLMGFFWKYSHAPQQCFPSKYINNVWHHGCMINRGR